MNTLLVKQSSILSAILGAAIGVLTLIPIVRNLTFMVLILCLSAVVIVYMKRHDLVGILDVREGALLGGIIGFVSFVAFSIVYIPLVSIISLIFKSYNTSGIIYLVNASGFFVLVMLVLFLAVLSALMNAFAGLTTIYVYEILSGIKKEQNENVNFEIKE